ncbi:hypothetical protein R1sor_017908 [Riccia sorocarpa]|uniref:Nucleotide-sugar transporter n=1 Tax=Riccia sorocarpa TaxID=122646 RepID=A0ABD3I9A5_9MARC
MRNAGGGSIGIHDLERDVDLERDEKSEKAKVSSFSSSKLPVRLPAVFVASVLTLFTSSQGVLTTLSQTNGGYIYDYGTVPFLAELMKLGVSAFLLWREITRGGSVKMTKDWKSVRLFPIPSIIYVVHNNIQFATLTYVDTSTYQILGNLKIVTTAILFRAFLKKKLSRIQWIAIVLLTLGTTTSQGYLLAVLSACLSGLAGVYTEYLMKKNDDTLNWQNVQLYAFGVLFNGLRLSLDDFNDAFSKGVWFTRLFSGYNFTTLLVVVNLGCTGLLVSWIMKFADNIVKVYSTSMAMLLTMLLSVYLFNYVPTLQLFIGIAICGISLQLYFTPPQQLAD